MLKCWKFSKFYARDQLLKNYMGLCLTLNFDVLQVMLEHEQEEDREKQQEIKRQTTQKLLSEHQRALKSWLFGPNGNSQSYYSSLTQSLLREYVNSF